MASTRSRVHPKFKTKYRVRNWSTYDRALVRRGDLTIWFTPEAIDAWEPRSTGRRGARRKCSDLAIETALTLRLVFNLPLRQTEGFLNSLFGMLGIDLSAPDHTARPAPRRQASSSCGRRASGTSQSSATDSVLVTPRRRKLRRRWRATS